MPEVAAHLIPTDGLTNSNISMTGLEVASGGGAYVNFAITDEGGNHIGIYSVFVEPMNQTVDAMIAEAHRRMCDVLRQWLYVTDVKRQAYAQRSG